MINYDKILRDFLATQAKNRIKVGVIGDVIIDEYYNVQVERISAEFPIPIMQSNPTDKTIVRPGGAANVAHQLTPFNTQVMLFGCMEKQAVSDINKFGFGITHVNSVQASRKRRFYSDDFYALTRWDIENNEDYDSDVWKNAREQLYDKIEAYIEIEGPDIIILSDYGKGLFHGQFAQSLIELCNDLDIPTIVDPKDKNLMQWSNCTVFKANHKEATYFADCDANGIVGNLVRELSCEAVVVTSDKCVTTYVKNELDRRYCISKPVEVRSVIGAGDCFASAYALALANGFSYRESSIIAHHAGAVYVQDKHNALVTPYRLQQHIDPIKSKIQNPDDLAAILKQTANKIVWTNGCFDLLHSGHIEMLRFAKAQGEILVVGVDSDANVVRLKGADRPVKSSSERALLLASLQFVDFVVVFDGTPDKVIKKLPEIEVLVKGGDYTADNVIGSDLVKSVAIAPFIDGYSTTQTIEKLCPK